MPGAKSHKRTLLLAFLQEAGAIHHKTAGPVAMTDRKRKTAIAVISGNKQAQFSNTPEAA